MFKLWNYKLQTEEFHFALWTKMDYWNFLEKDVVQFLVICKKKSYGGARHPFKVQQTIFTIDVP